MPKKDSAQPTEILAASALDSSSSVILLPNIVCVLSLQSCVALCNTVDCSPPGSTAHGILQARILGFWCFPPGVLPHLGIQPISPAAPCIAGYVFTAESPGCFSRSVMSNLLWTVNCGPRGSSVHGIFQARILEWVAIFSSRGSSLTQGWNPHLLHCRQILYHWATWEAHSMAHATH